LSACLFLVCEDSIHAAALARCSQNKARVLKITKHTTLSRRGKMISGGRSEFCLLNLPNDVLILILEHLSLDELRNLRLFVQFDHPGDLAGLIELYGHCDGQLFQRFPLSSQTLEWLRTAGIRVKKLQLLQYNDESARYLMHFKQSVKELDFSLSSGILNKYLNQIGQCPCLTSLSLASCRNISQITLKKLLKSNPQLER
jgi:hypothetical protein